MDAVLRLAWCFLGVVGSSRLQKLPTVVDSHALRTEAQTSTLHMQETLSINSAEYWMVMSELFQK